MSSDPYLDVMQIQAQSRLIREQQRTNELLSQANKDAQEADYLLERYNKLVQEYNVDTGRFVAQRDECAAIIKENIDKLPFDYEEVRNRVNAAGDQAEEEVRRQHGYN